MATQTEIIASLALSMALGQTLSYWEGLSDREAYEAIVDASDNGTDIPDSIVVWQPFENMDATELFHLIDNVETALISYAREVWEAAIDSI